MADLLYGFTGLKDVVNERVTGDLIVPVTEAIDRTIEVHNKVTEDMLRLFTQPTTQYKVRYKSPFAAKLQPLDEYGRARKVRQAGYYDVAFPIKSAGTALGETRLALAKMTIGQVNERIALILDADKRWLRDEILSALFGNTEYTFMDEEHGDLTIKPIANGDDTRYLLRMGAEQGETADHFLSIPSMDDANNNFSAIHQLLTKRPENAGDGKVITFIPTNLRDDVENLAAFKEASDPDITEGIGKDRLTGTLNASVPGEVLGKVSRNWIVEWGAMPSDYMISVITSGDRALAMRQHPEAELQGFYRSADRVDSPFFESQYERHAGFGGWNRVNVVVTKVGGAYSVPSGFERVG